jgi:hypothetical protein
MKLDCAECCYQEKIRVIRPFVTFVLKDCPPQHTEFYAKFTLCLLQNKNICAKTILVHTLFLVPARRKPQREPQRKPHVIELNRIEFFLFFY